MSTWASRNRTAVISVVVVIAAALALLVGVLALTNPGSGSTAATAAPGTVEPTPEPEPTTPALTPEEQAKADIETAFRDWLAAVDQAWRTGTDPVVAAAPYVSGAAAEESNPRLRDYQAVGFVITGGAVELQRLDITSLDLTGTPPTATVDYCFRDTREYILNGAAGALDDIYYGTNRWEKIDGRWMLVEDIEGLGEEDVSTSGFTC